jgi:hypothetical protein
VKASKQRKRPYMDVLYKENDEVFYQNRNKKAWLGPVKIFAQRGNDVFLWAHGDIKKVARCKVKPF